MQAEADSDRVKITLKPSGANVKAVQYVNEMSTDDYAGELSKLQVSINKKLRGAVAVMLLSSYLLVFIPVIFRISGITPSTIALSLIAALMPISILLIECRGLRLDRAVYKLVRDEHNKLFPDSPFPAFSQFTKFAHSQPHQSLIKPRTRITKRMKLTDGTTPLLTDEQMRELGFTDRVKGRWYLTSRVGSRESFNLSIDKKTGDYSETVIDEDFGQPAYFGRMRQEFRHDTVNKLWEVLNKLHTAGLRIEVDPCQYMWSEWPANRPLQGTEADRVFIQESSEGRR